MAGKHLLYASEILHILQSACMLLHLRKYTFFRAMVTYLVHFDEPERPEIEGFAIGPLKVVLLPRNIWQLRLFSGLCDLCCRLVYPFAHIADGLYEMLHKESSDALWNLVPEKLFVFQWLIEALKSVPIVYLSQPHHPYSVETNILECQKGSVLFQTKAKLFFSQLIILAEHFQQPNEIISRRQKNALPCFGLSKFLTLICIGKPLRTSQIAIPCIDFLICR